MNRLSTSRACGSKDLCLCSGSSMGQQIQDAAQNVLSLGRRPFAESMNGGELGFMNALSSNEFEESHVGHQRSGIVYVAFQVVGITLRSTFQGKNPAINSDQNVCMQVLVLSIIDQEMISTVIRE